MANKSKAKGTRFETQAVRYLRAHLGNENIERRALHGNNDMGDIFRVDAHGYHGIVECKAYGTYGPALLDDWKRQTVAEREASGAGFALLFVKEPGCGDARFGNNSCYVQIRDLERISYLRFLTTSDEVMDMWVRVTVSEACRMMRASYRKGDNG